MAKITVYLSLKDDKVQYRYPKGQGKSKNLRIKPGAIIIWMLDKNSGIKNISGINVVANTNYLSQGPVKKSSSKWQARISKKAKGEAEIELFVIPEKSKSKKSAVTLKTAGRDDDGDASKIIIRV